MSELPRRDALRLTALATAIPAFQALLPTAAGAATPATAHTAGGSSAAGAAPGPQLPTPASWIVKPFDNTRVTLARSLFTDNRDRVLTFLRAYPADRMLAVFRTNAGLDTHGAQPPGGWETADGNLRGHFAGHYLSALSLAYAGTGEQVHKDKADYMVGALGACQDALAALVGTDDPAAPSRAGYLAAYPETQYVLLEQYATYPRIWAPWYTCHMIMRGLLDAYQHTGNEQALRIVRGMGDWAYSRLGHLPRTQLDRMWRIYIAGEYNAMPVVMADLYALTGDEKYLTTAKCFDNTYLFEAAVANEDTLDGEHANQHIPQYQGYLEIYEQTGEQRYLAAARNFWGMVVPHRTYVDGGMAGSGEIFGARDVIAATIQQDNAETCCVYNMLKLSRSLFFHTADPKYLQYYERSLYGQILGSRRNTASDTNPLLTYFVPVNPGAHRSYGNLGTCCGGTGLETHAKFQDSVYFSSADNSTLYVNLYLPSTLDWPERGLTITQSTDYPTDPAGTSTLTITGDADLDLRLRVPYWVERGFTVRVNGVRQQMAAAPGTYVSLSRRWRTGDRVEIAAPFTLRIERALDDPATQAVAYGPVPLVIRSSATEYQNLTLYRDYPLSRDLSQVIRPTGEPMTFTANGLTLVPFYINTTESYHMYFRRAEPEIVFGAVGTGIENRTDAAGLTFLDEVWDRGPFHNRGGLVRAVTEVADARVATGDLTLRQRQVLIEAAARAQLPS
ncbi:glycoside hydrolase family 127 protein [Streptomyces shenzhenensis]|uniref:Glycosyl hydrolase n=1 Tax=Streptomyces shenzhenensis TaxID=943815 RepID=A0A3M0IKK3_9ACTN|nr:beta-L-arabinofuranosidase domain-containing protein [Streptomyces shenzhenensis]RMB82526.1 glycosyl hydrolase [Streptomyces shenzhenensis]